MVSMIVLKKNELKDAAVALGMHPKTFTVMKSTYPDKFQHIYDYCPDDFATAYKLYLDEVKRVQDGSKKMYKELEKHRLLTDFSHYVYKKGLYGSKTWSSAAKMALFTSANGISYHNTFLKFKAILEAYPKYIVNR